MQVLRCRHDVFSRPDCFAEPIFKLCLLFQCLKFGLFYQHFAFWINLGGCLPQQFDYFAFNPLSLGAHMQCFGQFVAQLLVDCLFTSQRQSLHIDKHRAFPMSVILLFVAVETVLN